jgi:hypothetical protein
MIVDATKFEVRAFQILAQRLNDEIQDAALALANGSARGDSAENTAQSYSERTGYIRGLMTVVGLFEGIEDELIGRKRS